MISLDLGCCSRGAGHRQEVPALRVWAEVVDFNPVPRIPLADQPGLTLSESLPTTTILQHYSER